MTPTLRALLLRLDPALTLDRIDAIRDRILNTFTLSRTRVDDWAAFQLIMARFHRHCHNIYWDIRPPLPVNEFEDWCACHTLLVREYGPTGPTWAWTVARSGLDGGLIAILKALATRIPSDRILERVESETWAYLTELPADTVLEDIRDYLREYGRLLPGEITGAGPGYLYHKFPSILQQHPYLARRLRSLAHAGGPDDAQRHPAHPTDR